MKPNFKLIYLFMTAGLLWTTGLYANRIYGGFYTEGKIANLRANCERYEWARKQRDAVVSRAAKWLAKSDEALWEMVPGQDLPRCIDVTFDRLTKGPKFLGCLKCGHKISRHGNYPYNPDFEKQPWKLTCPSCQAVFPTNDFGKYYKTAIDERGLFNPAKGDKRLLYNTAHPDPQDPLHKYGVDDGFGYVNAEGRSYKFVGYYAWKYWDEIGDGLRMLADAFLYTGDKRYAAKAAILLDRIADVYPDMDWKPYADRGWYHSDGGRNMGKIEGSIWETNVVQNFADAYDKILSGTVDQPGLYAFLLGQSKKYKLGKAKGTRGLFVKNVDDGILRTGFKAVLSRQVYGNQGMHQLSAAKCAIALNSSPETSEWLDWIFAPGGGDIPGLMIRNFDRDGTSDEGAPGYAFMWGNLVAKLAQTLAGYPAYTKHHIYRDLPQFSATFMTAYRMAVLGVAVPNIGDSGSTGLVSKGAVSADFIALGYAQTRDPEMALAAYRANGNTAKGLGLDIFAENPELLGQEIERAARQAAAVPNRGNLMSGFGLATLEAGTGMKGTAIASNYGRTIKHAHPDLLNFDLFAFGKWMAPDHGYPEYATRWPSNNEWTGSTISHNLVYVNKQPQKEGWGGHTRLFKQLKGFGAFELDGSSAYPSIKGYTRTMLLIGGTPDKAGGTDSNAYVLDIFRVTGGADHVYSFHGPPGIVTTAGLELKKQEKGSYAGEDVPKGVLAGNTPIGYAHLYNVQRDNQPPGQFMIDWKVDPSYRGMKAGEDTHLRMHALSAVQDVTLADGDPPQNKPGNPKTLGYVLMHRQGENLNSNFVSVLEPYQHNPFLKSLKRLDDGKDNKVALKIELLNGEVDYVLYNPDGGTPFRLDNGMLLNGSLGYIKEKAGKPVKGILIDGTLLKYHQLELKSEGAFTGKVVKMNKGLGGGGWLLVDTALPADGSLTGEQLLIATKGNRDASYTIKNITREGNLTRVYCGPITFVSDYSAAGGKDDAGQAERRYTYDFDEGATFKVSSHTQWEPNPPATKSKQTMQYIGNSKYTGGALAVVAGKAPLAHTTQLLPADKNGKIVGKANPGLQLKQLFENADLALKTGGSGLDRAVKLNVCVADNKLVPELRKYISNRFKAGKRPAVSLVTGDIIPSEALFAIDAIGVSDLSAAPPHQSLVAVLPGAGVAYVSGQAANGEIAGAARATLKQLDSTLQYLGLKKSDVVQVKSFICPAADIDLVKKEMAAFFEGYTLPPTVYIEWTSKKPLIEIELIAAVPPALNKPQTPLDFITPAGMTASPVYAKVTRINYGSKVYLSSLYGETGKEIENETAAIFKEMSGILTKAGTDFDHLVKATYYVVTDSASNDLNIIRPKYYKPESPPAASKAKVKGVGIQGKELCIDMIGVVKEK
ncbi:enamine deaminase RidA (YjgF/YER057c/UK114 family) [Pedobacter africanus]|uniref:Enamine deaminase RidA (YjgF/YER057c/UK114 family) n=1 Tax=Pedobacter africanus TaxID=151894 RepID=A0ACC6KXT2_9SPHI|nr:Rid family hydrolase [Pedobacter africanus]MDR6783929.1 enamine deaminase RidA (YjgF/YER057c/UK114 family) [Pedobacter africanus]